jgi:hypothetical protein
MTLGLMVLSVTAIAKPPFLKTFEATYKIKETSNLHKAGCAICHAGGPPKLNPYGEDVKKQLETSKAEAVTPETLKKIEKLDSDKDGFTNIKEIKADTLPGDPESKPAGKKPSGKM